jgi:hypothetical protein
MILTYLPKPSMHTRRDCTVLYRGSLQFLGGDSEKEGCPVHLSTGLAEVDLVRLAVPKKKRRDREKTV